MTDTSMLRKLLADRRVCQEACDEELLRLLRNTYDSIKDQWDWLSPKDKRFIELVRNDPEAVALLRKLAES